jgi:hypothetical protein
VSDDDMAELVECKAESLKNECASSLKLNSERGFLVLEI